MYILNLVHVNLIYNTNHNLFLWIDIFISTTDLYNTTAHRRSCHLPNRNKQRTCLQLGVSPFAFRYQGNGATPLPTYWYHSKANWLRYNFAADSFYIMKLYSRLLILYCWNCPKDDKFRYLIPILRKLGVA